MNSKNIVIFGVVIVVLAAVAFYLLFTNQNSGQSQLPQPAQQATPSEQSTAANPTTPSAAATFDTNDNLDQSIQDLNIIQK
jgi:flagellar basal body-associated protein FliL